MCTLCVNNVQEKSVTVSNGVKNNILLDNYFLYWLFSAKYCACFVHIDMV